MRNQKLLVKVVLKIAMMNVNIVMEIKMLIRKLYLKLMILREKECHRTLNRLQQVQHKCIFMLIDNFSLNGKQFPLCYFSSQCVVQKKMMDRRYTNFNHDFALVHVFILQCFNSIAQITKCSNC